MMRTSDLVASAGRALRANPMRSALTALGVIIGVASVVAMVALGSGAQAQVERSIASLGSNLLIVVPGAMRGGGQQGATESFHGCLHWQGKERHRKKSVLRHQRIQSTGAVTICGKTTSSARIST